MVISWLLSETKDWICKWEEREIHRRKGRAGPCQHHQLYFERGPAVLFWGKGLWVKRARERRCSRMEWRVRWGAGAGQGVASRWEGQRRPLSRLSEVRMVGWKAGWWTYKWTRLFSHIPHQTMFSLLFCAGWVAFPVKASCQQWTQRLSEKGDCIYCI